MTITVNPDLNLVVEQPLSRLPLAVVKLPRGPKVPIWVQFARDGAVIDPSEALTSGTLVVGLYYKITTFVAGDSFTNVGAASNATSVYFLCTATTPTTWTNSSTLQQCDSAGVLFSLIFSVKKNGEYDGAVLVLATGTDFTKFGTGTSTIFKSKCSFSTAEINTLLGVDSSVSNDESEVTLMGEVSWLGPDESKAFPFQIDLQNDSYKVNDVVTSTPGVQAMSLVTTSAEPLLPGSRVLTAGSNITITADSGTVTIASTGGGGGGGGGSGTVTSVAQSFTGGLISVAGSPITSSGTLALTVAGTSGGIPYFSSGTTWATSAALAASALVVGGGAGAAPATITTGANVLTALGVAVGSAGAFVTFNGALGTPASGVATNLTGTASGLTAGNVTTNANLTGPVTSTGNATAIANGAISNAMLANGAVANLSGTNTGDQTITLTGDVTGGGTGSFATTLATVNSNVGNFTNASLTVNAKGLVTAASSGTPEGNTKLPLAGGVMTGAITNDGVINVNIGNGNTSSGTDATAVGKSNTASGSNSSALGRSNTASGQQSSAFGYLNTATATGSSAVGRSNNASGTYSSAVGYQNTASASDSSAVGSGNDASGAQSSAFGRGNTASGNQSYAFGRNNTASSYRSSAVGVSNIASGIYSSAFGYINTASGNSSSAVGKSNTASGLDSHAVGVSNVTSGTSSSAFGYDNNATGNYSSAVGRTNTASGTNSSALGYVNNASNTNSSAVGKSNTASGTNSSALGYSNIASATGSSAVGHQNTASGTQSSAVGYYNTASGTNSSAVGFYNIASGNNSSAVGYNNTATVNYSSAFGYNVQNGTTKAIELGQWDSATARNGAIRLHTTGMAALTVQNRATEYGDAAEAQTVTITRYGTTATVSLTAHGYSVGSKITVAGANEVAYNGNFTVTAVGSADAFNYTAASTPSASPATGTVTCAARLGSERDNRLARGMFAIRRDGLAFYLDYNDGGTIKNISLGTAA